MFLAVLARNESVIAAVPLAGLAHEPHHVACAIDRALELVKGYERMGDKPWTVIVSTGDTGDVETEYGTLYESRGGAVLCDRRRGDGDPIHAGAYGPWPSEPDGTPYKLSY
jgi:hypothetical protein